MEEKLASIVANQEAMANKQKEIDDRIRMISDKLW